MRRRKFVSALGVAAATWPLIARAQQGERLRHLGILMASAESDTEGRARLDVFKAQLVRLGWAEGRNIQIDTRWPPSNDAELRQRFAQELVALKPDLILTNGTPAATTVLQQTNTISVLFVQVADPLNGLVKSYSRPGANATGFTHTEPSIATKWLELLKEIAPSVTKCAVLFNPATTPYAQIFLDPLRAAAQSLEIEMTVATVGKESEIETVIAAHAHEPTGSLVVMPDTFMTAHRTAVAAMAARYRLPAVYPFRYFAAAGGLLTYGSDTLDNFQRAATYASRILKGERPGDLPIQAPVKFELVINLKAAKALGLTVPRTLLARADEVIE